MDNFHSWDTERLPELETEGRGLFSFAKKTHAHTKIHMRLTLSLNLSLSTHTHSLSVFLAAVGCISEGSGWVAINSYPNSHILFTMAVCLNQSIWMLSPPTCEWLSLLWLQLTQWHAFKYHRKWNMWLFPNYGWPGLRPFWLVCFPSISIFLLSFAHKLTELEYI